jgi:tRNA(adenine34) deaminase
MIQYMQLALEEARLAAEENEVPVGAVLVYQDRVIARNHNRMIQLKNPLAHAELLTLQAASAQHPDPWLLDSTLYVTLEPCAMCAGAMVLARIKKLVYAAADPKAGACGSTMDIIRAPHLNHHAEVDSGLMQSESSELLKSFFKRLRQ